MLRATLSVLERERRHLPPAYDAALRESRRRWRSFYGEHLSVEIRREWRGARRPGALARSILFLFRHCPREATAHICRKLSRVLRRLPPADIDATSQPPPATSHRSVERANPEEGLWIIRGRT
jgi:hypothetical protein